MFAASLFKNLAGTRTAKCLGPYVLSLNEMFFFGLNLTTSVMLVLF